jgi:outer membrane protein assembly factor BamB
MTMTPRTNRLDLMRHPVAFATSLAILSGLMAAPAFAQDPPADPPAIGPFADVPTYRVDDHRTHVQPGAAPRTTPGLAWSEKVGDEIHFNPILLDETLFVGDYEGSLHALDPASGASRWTYQADGPIDGASAQDGTVVFSDGSGRLHAVDAASGEARWVVEGGYTTSLGPPIADGVVYWGTVDGVIHGIELGSCEEVWSHTLPAAALSITIADGLAFAGTSEGMVHAISIADGREVWRPIHLLSNRPSSMPVADGLLYVASNQPPGEPVGELLAVDVESGEVRWRFRSPSGRQVTPGAIQSGVLYVASEADGLYAIDARSGETRWRSDAPFAGTPITLAGDVLITPADGDLYGFDMADGAELWRVPLGGGGNTGAIASGGLVFQADDRGNVWAFGDAALAQAPGGAAQAGSPEVASPFVHLATWDAAVIEGLDQPCGGDFGPDGLFWFANCGTSEVIAVDPDGVVVQRWGAQGTREGEFDFLRDPSDPFSAIGGVGVSPDGSAVYVADTVNRRVQQFTPDGAFVRQFGSYGSGDGQFLEPIDLDVGPDGPV